MGLPGGSEVGDLKLRYENENLRYEKLRYENENEGENEGDKYYTWGTDWLKQKMGDIIFILAVCRLENSTLGGGENALTAKTETVENLKIEYESEYNCGGALHDERACVCGPERDGGEDYGRVVCGSCCGGTVCGYLQRG